MSEWKRNRRKTGGYPAGVKYGMKIEAVQRNGTVFSGVVGEHEWLRETHFNSGDGEYGDILRYRVLPSEPAAEPAKPDYSKGFPSGTTAKDIGAKVGDQFMVISNERPSAYRYGDIVSLFRDDESPCPEFAKNDSDTVYIHWARLAPIPQKTAIELQAEEVGIPKPVQYVNDGDTSPERVEKQEEIEHDADDDAPIGKRVADAIIAEMMVTPASVPLSDALLDASSRIKWEAVFGLRDISDACRSAGVQIKFESAESAPTTAQQFLQSALSTLTQRGKDYDKPEGERSAAAVAVAFNAITGRNLTEAEVWLVLQLVKDVRQWQNPERYHADSALDCVAYAALKAEALANTKEGK